MRSVPAACIAIVALLAAACDRTGSVGERITAIPSPAGPGSMAPHLSVAPGGDVVMSWLQPRAGGGHALHHSTLGPAGWSEPRVVAGGDDWFVNWADFPSVTPITATDWAAHWLVKQPGGTYSYDVAIALSRDGGATWSAPLTPHDDGTRTEHGFVTLFPWNGGVGAVWLDGRNSPSGMTVRYAQIGFDGAIRSGGQIDDLTCDCCASDVAVTDDGPVATWRDRTREEIRDIAVSAWDGAGWSAPRIVAADGWHIQGCPVNGSTIAARGERVVVAWYTAARREPKIQVAWSDDGGRSFSAPALVEAGSVNGRVDVALVGDDLAVVSWTGKTAKGEGQLRLRAMPRQGEPGPVRVVAAGDISRAGGFPQMVSSPRGLVLAWTVPGEPSRIETATAPL